jgi:beta-N-acetylhexosaminidase
VLLQTEQLDHFSKTETAAVLRGYEEAGLLPMFVGVNEEGGEVNTVSVLPQIRQKAFLSPRELLTTGGMKLVDNDAREKSDLLRELGVNMNFAPVCDVVTDENAMMYPRSGEGDADDVGRYAETVVMAMHDRRMIAVLKHFPGYGDLPAKEHTDVLTDSRTIEALRAVDLVPYIRAIDAGAQVVMMGNVIVTAVDAGLPAGLSREVHGLLRRELGFEGVIVSSDLNALGMGRYGSSGELAVLAVRAGSDLVLTEDYAEGIEAVAREVRMGNIAVERIDESVLRILKLKIGFGMMG